MAKRSHVLIVSGLLVLPWIATAHGMSDPTQPADYSTPAAGASEKPRGPVLQSTLVSPTRKRAVIDGKTVGIGDKVDDAKVVDIRSYEVVLRRGGRDMSLRLMPKLAKEQR